MTAELEPIRNLANSWEQTHPRVSSELIDWLEIHAPPEARVPSVLNIILVASQSTTVVQEIFQDKLPVWDDLINIIVDHMYQESGRHHIFTALEDMSLARSERGKIVWSFTDTPYEARYNGLVDQGLLVKTRNGAYALDEDVYKVFGPVIKKKSSEWLDSDPHYRNLFLDHVVDEGPFFYK